VNRLGKPIDILVYGHRGSALESGTDSPVNIYFTLCYNRCPAPDTSRSSDDDSSDDMNPESSATDAKRARLLKTTTTKKGTRNTGTVQQCLKVAIVLSGSDSDVFYEAGANLASTEIPALCSNAPPPPGKQSHPTANLNSHIWRSGLQTGRGSKMKKVSGLSTWTAVNINGKRGRGAKTHGGQPNSPADAAEPPR